MRRSRNRVRIRLALMWAALLAACGPSSGIPSPPAPQVQATPSVDTRDREDKARQLVAQGRADEDPLQYESALDVLDPLLNSRRASAEAWYLTGLAKLELGRLAALPRWREHQVPGLDYTTGARRAFTRALRLDPSHNQAATALATLATENQLIDGQRTTLVAIRAAGTPSADSTYWFARASAEFAWHEPDSALAALAGYVEAGGSASRAARIRGQILATEGLDAAASAAWFSGLADTVRFDRAGYREDLAWIADGAELQVFDSIGQDALAPWMRAFWERRAAADFRTVDDRLAEHLRRIVQAVEQFRLWDKDRDINSAMPFLSDQALVDDRGLIWVRHGPPDEARETGVHSGGWACAFVSWLYDTGTSASLSVHFRSYFSVVGEGTSHGFCSGVRDFHLVPGGEWLAPHARWMAERDSMYAEWMRARRARRPVTAGRLSREIVRAETDRLQLAVLTDSYAQPIDSNLGGIVRGFGRGDPEEILVAWGVPSTRLEAIPARGGAPARYALRIRLAAIREAGVPVTLDTTLLFDASRVMSQREWLVGYLTMPVPAGEWELRSLITDQRVYAGSSGLQLGIHVPTARPGTPWLSDLILGSDRSDLIWSMEGTSFPLSPLRGFGPTERLWVHFGFGGMPPGTAVAITTRVLDEDGEKEVFAVEETVIPDGPTTSLSRTIDLARLALGRYRLQVTLRGPDGGSLAREQVFAVQRDP